MVSRADTLGMWHKTWDLLTPVQRRSAYVQFGLMIGGTVLETVSVGLVVPAIALLVQVDFAVRHPALADMLGYSQGVAPHTLLVRAMIALVAVYAVKNAFLGLTAWRQNRYIFDLIVSCSQRLFTQYLRQPYAFHLERNSAQLVRNVVGEVDIFANGVVASLLIVLSEVLVLCALLVLLLAVEPLGAATVALVTGVTSLVFYILSRPYIEHWGRERQHHAGLRFQHLQQGLGGVKEIKLLGREGEFINRFRVHSEAYAVVACRQNTLLKFPRLWLELLVVAGLAALVGTMVAQGKPFEVVLPTLGLFAAAAFRLMPSLNRILTAMQALRFGLPVIDVLHAEVDSLKVELAQPAAEPLDFVNDIRLEDVAFRYPTAETSTLPGISICIPRGSAIGFIGPSGAGKSTLVDVLLGLLAPDSGRVLVDGIDVRTNLRGWQAQIGYVPQSIFLTDESLRGNVAFGVPTADVDELALERAIRAAQLEGLVASLPNGLDTVVGERGVRLSGGQRQRIGIARALYHDPAVLVLDEATSSLDTATEDDVMQAVRALHGEKTIIMVSHRLSTVSDCDRLYRLADGVIVEEGEFREVLRHAAQSQ